MSWGPWFAHKTVVAGYAVLAKCDQVGETLADFFGITSPKYSYEIELYKRMQAEQAQIAKDDIDAASWSEVSHLEGDAAVVLDAPVSNGSILNQDQSNRF